MNGIDDADLVDEPEPDPPKRAPAYRTTPRVYIARHLKTKTGKRSKRYPKEPDPLWWADIADQIEKTATLEQLLKTARAKRNYLIWLACHVHGASTNWMARRLGVSNIRVIEIVRAGALLAADAGQTVEAAYEAIYGPETIDAEPDPEDEEG